MSTAALQNIWDGLLAYNLTTANKRWLAERLLDQVAIEESESLKPYTMDEINAMIDRAEADYAAGRVYDDEEVWRDIEKEFAEPNNLS